MRDVTTPAGRAGSTEKLRDEQVQFRSTWKHYPDRPDPEWSWFHVIHVVPSNGSTVTFVNALDPETTGWYDRPGAAGTLVPAGRP